MPAPGKDSKGEALPPPPEGGLSSYDPEFEDLKRAILKPGRKPQLYGTPNPPVTLRRRRPKP